MVIALVCLGVCAQTLRTAQISDFVRLDGFEKMLSVMPRPERRLTQEEADQHIKAGKALRFHMAPPFTATELNRLSVLPTETLGAKIVAEPKSSPWETYELFVRKDPAAVSALLRSAKAGNAGAVAALDRTPGLIALNALLELASGPDSESKAAAGVLLGRTGFRKGIPGMRLAVTKYPLWSDAATLKNLLAWGDSKNLAHLRRYFGKGIRGNPVRFLAEFGTKECLTVLFELADTSSGLAETVGVIAELDDPRVRPVMRRAVLDPSGPVRRSAAIWFMYNGDRSDLPALKKSLADAPKTANGDPDPEVDWTGQVITAIKVLELPK